jgi:hypothetical protein
MRLAALIGRTLLASIFAASGLIKLISFEDVRDVLIAHYLPVSPGLGT